MDEYLHLFWASILSVGDVLKALAPMQRHDWRRHSDFVQQLMNKLKHSFFRWKLWQSNELWLLSATSCAVSCVRRSHSFWIRLYCCASAPLFIMTHRKQSITFNLCSKLRNNPTITKYRQSPTKPWLTRTRGHEVGGPDVRWWEFGIVFHSIHPSIY